MKTYVQLADYGALLNLLPICAADAQAGENSTIVTTKPYSDLLEGVSYVEAKVLPESYPPHDLTLAMQYVKTNIEGPVICTQVNGPQELVRKFTYQAAGQQTALTTSWQKEMWKVAGRLSEWDSCLPLTFDKRDSVRETRLLREVFPGKGPGSKKPVMLLALEGKSSPFPHKGLLRYLLQKTFGKDWRIVELPQAVRLYDLLALYEKASLLVAVDSAPLHLAWAVRSLPVLALTNDKPLLWTGSPWRPNMVWYCRYGDWLDRWKEMLDTIQRFPIPKPQPFFLRVWSEYESKRTGENADARFWFDLPISLGACGRDSAGILGDPKRVPYLRDCIRMAIQKAEPGQQIMLHRPDVELGSFCLIAGKATYTYRIQGDSFAPICDLFTAPREWWQEALPELPDLLLGSDYWWSQCLWAIFRARGAVDITGCCTRPVPTRGSTAVPPVQPPRIAHNVNLWEKYATENSIATRYPAVSEQLEALPLDTSNLFPGGYNPAVISKENKVLLAYRFHGATPATSLALAEIGPKGEVLSNQVILTGQASFEDPKFFVADGGIRLSFVQSTWPAKVLRSVVKIARPTAEGFETTMQPALPGNDGKSMQKNAVFFEREGLLYCLWNCSPVQQIFRLEGEEVSQPLETEGPRWAYGHIKGGTPPLEYEGKLLRFFHSTLDNEFAFPHPTAFHRRYFMGALLMEPEPPFKTVAVSRRPIVYGSEAGGPDPRPFHFKPRVIFPGGALALTNCFAVAVGINDAECALLKITPQDLHL